MKSMRIVYLLTFLVAQYALVHSEDSSTSEMPVVVTETQRTSEVLLTTKEQVTSGQSDPDQTVSRITTAAPPTVTATAIATTVGEITTTLGATTTTNNIGTFTTTTATTTTTTTTTTANTTTEIVIRTVRPTPSNPTWKIVGGLAGGLAGLGLIGMAGGIYICYKSSNGRGAVRV